MRRLVIVVEEEIKVQSLHASDSFKEKHFKLFHYFEIEIRPLVLFWAMVSREAGVLILSDQPFQVGKCSSNQLSSRLQRLSAKFPHQSITSSIAVSYSREMRNDSEMEDDWRIGEPSRRCVVDRAVVEGRREVDSRRQTTCSTTLQTFTLKGNYVELKKTKVERIWLCRIIWSID